jgi:hypothetical protein
MTRLPWQAVTGRVAASGKETAFGFVPPDAQRNVRSGG